MGPTINLEVVAKEGSGFTLLKQISMIPKKNIVLLTFTQVDLVNLNKTASNENRRLLATKLFRKENTELSPLQKIGG